MTSLRRLRHRLAERFADLLWVTCCLLVAPRKTPDRPEE